jgi:murein DD-endopeptidase MepM/ murein hydrolase activator NlpD
MIRVENAATSTTSAKQASVDEILFASQSVPFFIYNSNPTAFVGIDLSKKPGPYVVTAKLSDGTILTATTTIIARAKIQSPLGVPAKLGGNSTTSQKNVVSNLAKENALIKSATTSVIALWDKIFEYPIKNIYITDDFGYSRLTGAYTITHLGTDLRAAEGTPVFAMNNGIVRLARATTIYGNLVIIDHGLGLQTLYAHLSKINLVEGQMVNKGEIIGLSGQTGYAEQPHLHISVKINKISVDPVKFLSLFKSI